MDYDITNIPMVLAEDNDTSSAPGPSTSAETTNYDADINSESDDTNESENEDEDENAKKKKIFRANTSKLSPHLKGLMGEANLRYARGDLETAKKMCFEVIRQSPDAYEPYLTLSQMYESTNFKKYKGFLMLASHLAVSNVSIWCRLAELHLQEGNVLEAVKCYSKVIKYEPNNIYIHKKRIDLLEKQGDTKMVLACKQTMSRHIPKKKHDLIINLSMEVAKEHFKHKNYIRAIEALRVPLKRIPKQVTEDCINMILDLLLLNERYSECLDILTQFCGFSFDVTVTEEKTIIINSFSFPENLQVDLKMKFIVCLVRIGALQHVLNLVNQVLIEEDVESVGDLYLDVAEALMQTGNSLEAVKLFVPLVKSKNFSLAGVWLKYAECLTACNMPEQAIEAYFTVMAMAPSHVEILYPLAMLLLQLNKKDEALEVLSQDLSSNKLDVAVLIEQIKLLKQINDWDSFWKSVELLLSRHCIVLKYPEELRIVLALNSVREKITKIKKMRIFRSENTAIESNFTSIREPPVEEEFKVFMDILQLAKDKRDYAIFQKFSFTGLCSKRFLKYFNEIYLSAFYSCLFNNDTYHGYYIVRELILRHPQNNLCWNWLTLLNQSQDDIRHTRFLERYREKLPLDKKHLVIANYNITIGNYPQGLQYYMKEFKKKQTPLASFLIGVIMLQLYCQRMVGNRSERSKKKVLAETVTYLFLNYSKLRTKNASQEVYYNLGRMYHQLGVIYLAEYYYKEVFKVTNNFLEEHEDVLCLKREAAFNLHLIYKNNGNFIAARNVLIEHIVI